MTPGAILASSRASCWISTRARVTEELDEKQWLRLAESREADHPSDAFAVYQAMAEEFLQTADRRAYRDGVRILKRAARAADAAHRGEDFCRQIGWLRDHYRRRPTLIAMLDKAGFE